MTRNPCLNNDVACQVLDNLVHASVVTVRNHVRLVTLDPVGIERVIHDVRTQLCTQVV